MTITSNFCFSASMAAAKLCEESSSSGLGGTLPDGSTCSAEPATACTHLSSGATPATSSESPSGESTALRIPPIFGRRMSASINSVFFTCESANARFDATVVLPSSGTEDVRRMVFCGLSRPDSSTPLRIERIASQNAFWLSSRNTRSSCRPPSKVACCSTPTATTPSRCSTAWLVLTVLSRRSSSSERATAAASAHSTAVSTMPRLFGPDGAVGSIAGSMTRAMVLCMSPMFVSLERWMNKS